MKKRSIRHRQSKRYSSIEQDLIIERFHNGFGDDRSADEIARSVGSSLATIKRWKQARKSNLLPSSNFAMTIDAAIARLADERDENRQTFLEALFKFVAWLRFPNAPSDHPAMITACMVTYFARSTTAETLDQLPADDLALLLRHIRIDTLRRVCTNESLALPIFELWEINDQPYKETDFFAEIAHFLLAYSPVSCNPRDRASLKKAYFVSQERVFRYRWPIAESTFRKYWKEYGASSPFLYVERFHSSLTFSLDPSDTNFASFVDEVLGQRSELFLYFAHCRFAVELLQSRLDKRAVARLGLPTFPDEVDSRTITPPSLPTKIETVMNGFATRLDKRK
jgi:hypothetical protein